MADTETTEQKTETPLVDRRVCEKCGLIHETELPHGAGAADNWKLVILSAVGIALLAFIWFFVFQWGVPLVKHINAIE